MAIGEHLPGVEVAVTVDGNDLKEYADTNSDGADNRTLNYIEATTNQTFAIRMKIGNQFEFAANCLCFYIYIDGTLMDSLSRGDADRGRDSFSSGVFAQGGLRKYQFTVIETGKTLHTWMVNMISADCKTVSDGYMLKGEDAKLKDLGSIVVKVEHKRKGSRKVAPPAKKANARTTLPSTTESRVSEDKSNTFKEANIVSEKAVKGLAISHSVRLAEAEAPRVTVATPVTSWRPGVGTSGRKRKTVPSSKTETTWETLSSVPSAVFVFKYRSLAALKSLMVIPRTPTPRPLEDRDANDLTLEELRELHRRSQAARKQQEAKQKVKREERDNEERPREIARPTATSTQLTIDDEGNVRQEAALVDGESQPEVIVLD